MFKRDPVNLIRIFHLAQKHNLAFHPDAMRAITRSLKLIDAKLRDDEEANRLFLEILTSKNDPETVLRRMNEAGVLGRFVPAFGKIVAMMQFNMYHHYTVDEHLLRCIGVLAEIERGVSNDTPLANELIHKLLPGNRTVLYVTLFLHDIAKGRIEDHSIAGARVARRFCPRLGFSAGRHRDRRLADRKSSGDVERGAVARSVRPQDDREFRRGGAVGRTAEAADHPHHRRHPRGRPRRVERLEGAAAAHALLRDRAGAHRRLLGGQPRPARRHGADRIPRGDDGLAGRSGWRPISPSTIRPIGSRSICRTRSSTPISCAPPRTPARSLATTIGFDSGAVTELTVLAPDHPWLLSIIAGACAMAGANIVDAQIYTTTDGRALDTISLSREFERDEDEERRANRIADSIEKALRGELRLPDMVGKRAAPKGRIKAFALEPTVTINNQWSHRYTMVEVTGLDRTGLLYEMTTTLSKLNLNIASAHVATFGERVVDVFYVTDLMGAQITSPTRQAAIKRALIALFAAQEAKPNTAKPKATPRRNLGRNILWAHDLTETAPVSDHALDEAR